MIAPFQKYAIIVGSKWSKFHAMRCKMLVSGEVFSVKCLAKDYDEAKKVALAQHPNARIMGVNVLSNTKQ